VSLFNRNKSQGPQKKGGGLTVSKRGLKDSSLGSDFILSAIQDGVVIVNQDNVIHVLNTAASQITGWPAEEAVGLNFDAVLPVITDKGQPVASNMHPIARALITGQPVRDNNVILNTKAGKALYISIVVSPIMDSHGHRTDSVVAVFRDIQKEKEEEARRSDFISTASHEMRTPLAAIEGYLSLALNPKTAKIDENARKYLEKATTSTLHLGELFRDLLTSSKAEDGRIASYPTVIEMGEIVAQVADAEKFHAKERNLELFYQVSGSGSAPTGKVVSPLYYAYVDPNRLREVLQNVIDNAIKYTPQGSVTVRLTGDDTVVQIQVQDTGAGIPADDIPHLFQKFYRVDNSSTRTVGGTGLGLFICRKIVELYNGRVWVESQLGKGSTFFISFPRLTAQQALEMQQNQASTISPPQSYV
jgi:PAS domain S-box-containing protein